MPLLSKDRNAIQQQLHSKWRTMDVDGIGSEDDIIADIRALVSMLPLNNEEMYTQTHVRMISTEHVTAWLI